MKILLGLLILTSCSRSIDGIVDGFSKENKTVISSKIECFSGASKFFEYSTTGRVWISEGGHYEIVEKDKLITTNGDCILYENFR